MRCEPPTIEPQLTPRDVATMLAANPARVPKSRVNAVRDLMRSGEIESVCEIIETRTGEKRLKLWTTPSRVAAYQQRKLQGVTKRSDEVEQRASSSATVHRLKTPEEMKQMYAEMRRAGT